MKALYIGRFQPLHKGHLKIIQDISKEFDEIIIGIGSSQYYNTKDNPFSSEERIKMLKESCKALNIKNYKIVLIPDIHNPPKWVDHVLKFVSDFDIVVSNNNLTLELFKNKCFKIKKTELYNKQEYSGKVIRDKIAKEKTWKKFVSKQVYDIIIKINGVERIKGLFKD